MVEHLSAYARCDTCVYWSPTGAKMRDTRVGVCRRGLPVIIPNTVENDPLRGCWPYTRDADWCGEYGRANSA